MRDEEIVRLVQESADETRAMGLAIIEILSSKLAPGSYATILSKADVGALLTRQGEIMLRFKKEREERARGLVLPPGAKT